MNRALHLIIPFAAAICGLARAGDAAQSVASIRSAVEAAVAATPGSTVSASIDERLHLPACVQPLVAQSANGLTVEVTCPGPAGWRLFVPVRITRSATVVVLTRAIAAGLPIPAEALAHEIRDVARAPGATLSSSELAVGKLARRSLPAGSLLTASDIAQQPVIRRGQSVTLIARGGGLEVRAAGRALADAAPGDSLAVENHSTRRVVQGWVQESGDVLIRL